MKNERRAFLIAAGAMMAGALLPAHAAAQLEVQQAGTLRVAVYADYAPFSARGKGIDVAIAQSLAERLGMRAEIVEFPPDENMSDDLRNMVWKGHYLGRRPADVMLHVPVDAQFAAQNDKVAIFGPYHLETMALARNPARVQAATGSAAVAFEVFTREKVGVELDTHASDFMLHVLNGRLRDNVVHFRSVAEAAAAMVKGEVSAVMAPRSQLEAALKEQKQFEIDALNMPELRVKGWPLGMAVKADSKELAAALSEALADLQRSGELARIFSAHGVTHKLP
ncbi:amino acid ABC transporter substrate-binding protein, PAAT family [Aromatoleum tolulyticum]|uniref:Amino acid ABC transporter substrate-binding protein, PAAT family n=1 Tax=Aromatoleum tolulyticum TaxID=34027 RepID=A0A1N6YHY8_9RHOO|nr:transporter substrate-binding domain-containing protein [Aromatoleum tolulyticum]SIR14252.1 amino acid ABC transporter substrate-binding protein, PAAT family [Aromatoleum tolulyticum]